MTGAVSKTCSGPDSSLAQARSIAPGSAEVLNTTVYWLRSVGRCPEVIEAAEHAIRTDPNGMRMWTGVYNELAVCKTVTGHAGEEIVLQARADQLNPRSPWKFIRYRRMGFALGHAGQGSGRNRVSRTIARHQSGGSTNQWTYRVLTAAYERSCRMEEAKRSLAAADRLWPYDTVRSHFPDFPSGAVFAEQIRGYQSGLRLAGGSPTTSIKIRTLECRRMAHWKPGSRDPHRPAYPGRRRSGPWNSSAFLPRPTRSSSTQCRIHGAGQSLERSGWRFAGLGGSFADTAQHRLGRKRRTKAVPLGISTDPSSRSVGIRNASMAATWRCARLNSATRRSIRYRGGREAMGKAAEKAEVELALQEW